MRLATTLALLLAATFAPAQVLELTGGQSTLQSGAGAGVRAYFPNHTVYLGGGFVDGRFALGLSDSFQFRKWDVTAGDQNFGGSLDASGSAIQARGLSIGRKSAKQTTQFFLGSTGTPANLGFFAGQHAQYLGAGFFFERCLKSWKLGTLEIIDHGKKTAIEGAGYNGHKLQASGAAGLLQSAHFATGQAEYSPINALHVLASRSNYFYENQQATADAVGAFALLGPVSIQGQAIRSTTAGRTTRGFLAGAGLRLGLLHVSGTWYESNHKPMTTASAEESFRHWDFSEEISRAAGQTSFAFGGGLHFNRVSFSVNHSIAFYPFGAAGFQQVTAIMLSFRIHDTTITGATDLLPTGPRYSAGADSFVDGPLHFAEGSAAGPRTTRRASGKYAITGRVVDAAGQPVAGAAVAVGGQIVYTDDAGRFLARERKDRSVPVVVRPAEFAAPGAWVVVSAPASAAPNQEMTITVRRKK